MTEQLRSIVAATLGVAPDKLRADASMRNTPQWDSLRQVLLMLEVERQFGVKVSNEEMAECFSIERIDALLAARTAPANVPTG